MEMVFSAYGSAQQVAPNIYDRTRPLPGYLNRTTQGVPCGRRRTAGGWMAPGARRVAEGARGGEAGDDSAPAMPEDKTPAARFIEDSVNHP